MEQPIGEAQFGVEEEGAGSKLKNNLAELIEFIAILAAIFVLFRFFIAEPHRVSGLSMFPNFHNDDLLITNKLVPKFISIQRGEVVILHNPRDNNEVFIKRIIGFPGEMIKVAGGFVFIGGNKLSEPYLPAGTYTRSGYFLAEGEEVKIPDKQYIVMGDNRSGSSDSREWGPVETDLIIGQAFLRYWPLPKAGLLKIDTSSN